MTCLSLQIEALGLPAGHCPCRVSMGWCLAVSTVPSIPTQTWGWWGSSLLAGSLTHISPPFLCISSPEFLPASSLNSPAVTLIFCCYEQALVAKPKSIASSVGKEDPAAEEHLNSVPGSLYDLAKNDNIGPKWAGMSIGGCC